MHDASMTMSCGDQSALGNREAKREGCLLTDPPCRRLLLACMIIMVNWLRGGWLK